jgi:hypothetical protein
VVSRSAWIGLIAALLPQVADAADQFDLICRGTDKVNGEPTPKEAHYRLDLAGGSWCEDVCDRVHPIVSTSPDRIVLQDDAPSRPLWAKTQHTILRTSGMVELTVFSSGYVRLFQAECEPKPFSGMPKPKF